MALSNSSQYGIPPMKPTLNVAIIGYNFMGRAHAQAWCNAPLYFDVDALPVLKVACGRSPEALQAFATRWGWQETATDSREVVTRDDIDIVDIVTPTGLHRDIAIAALQAGKHVFCEKPFALNAAEARKWCRPPVKLEPSTMSTTTIDGARPWRWQDK